MCAPSSVTVVCDNANCHPFFPALSSVVVTQCKLSSFLPGTFLHRQSHLCVTMQTVTPSSQHSPPSSITLGCYDANCHPFFPALSSVVKHTYVLRCKLSPLLPALSSVVNHTWVLRCKLSPFLPSSFLPAKQQRVTNWPLWRSAQCFIGIRVGRSWV